MCCFSGTIDHISDTKIFARSRDEVRQYLVYEMQYEAKSDLAMILPLPTPKNVKETAVRFLNLRKQKKFFDEMEQGFPKREPRVALGGGVGGFGTIEAKPKLTVKDVGAFEASFVPSVADFSRLDERFRLPDAVWTDTAPRYHDWGFAVFKLKSKSRRTHPMALIFPRRNPESLFFPTLHIHDGDVHEEAVFDHALYCQVSDGFRHDEAMDWEESNRPAGMFMNSNLIGITDYNSHVYRKMISGEHQNKDILV
jgi:hypothetical protein